MAFSKLDEAVSFARGYANKIRESMGPAESLAESKALTQMYNTANVLEDIAEMLERARCLATDTATRIGSTDVSRFCATWQLLDDGNKVILSRTKPATSITFEADRISFYRHEEDIKMEAKPGSVKICRWNMCIEYNPTSKEDVVKYLPEITYLMRHLLNAVRKSKEALIVCAKLNKPACLAV